jgi:tetratricopeptide (TPR) repeat protein
VKRCSGKQRRWLALVCAAAACAQARGGNLAQANAALQAGQADSALAILDSLGQADANSAEAHNLRCRVLYTLEKWDAATKECEQAAILDPQNSNFHMWLGRALGEKADSASFVSAYSMAKRSRAEFEKAVELNPRNAEALADLGEFYYSAPGVVGGGTGKAQSVAAKLDRLDPVRAHELRASIAQENRDLGTAERELREALAVSPHPAFQWIKLASFHRRNKRWTEMDSAIQNGKAAAERDRHAAVALYYGATVLEKANRNPALAIKLLEMYLASQGQTEEAPAFVAHVYLARLEKQVGDTAGAKNERSAALALASEYKPAQELKF